MELRVTRPGFIRGIQALASSPVPMPHLESIERWRRGNRSMPYDPNADASCQEMRAFVCGQCHVEYYCGPKTTLFYPWNNGLKVEQIESYYDQFKFPDGHRFYDWTHAESGAEVLKAQHPEQLAEVLALQRKAQWRLDFVAAENSMGFHAPQETAPVLAESIDFARQGRLAAKMLAVPAHK